jgi:hypothetical protein
VEGASQRKIERLIEDLGSERFEIREAAKQKLMEIEEAAAALDQAKRSADPEVRRRASEILLALEPKRAKRGLARAQGLAKDGRIIEAVDRIARWGEFDGSSEGWESLTQFADHVIKSAASAFPKLDTGFNSSFPAGEFRRYAKLVHPTELSRRKIDIDIGSEPPQNQKERDGRKLIAETHGKLLLRGEEVCFTGRIYQLGLSRGIIASAGDVQLMSAYYSLIVAGGDVKELMGLNNCILICDGDVELLLPSAGDNVIIARGSVTCIHGKLRRCMVRSGRAVSSFDGRAIALKEGAPDPLAFVKFFELADVGLDVADPPQSEKAEAEGVVLKDVRRNSPFAPGLRAGDFVTALDGTKTACPEDFRRLLRRKMGQGGPILTFSIRRGKETLHVDIPVKD